MLPARHIKSLPVNVSQPPTYNRRTDRNDVMARSRERKFPTFKISQYKDDIVNAVRDNHIIGINAPTGTGKTRYIPHILATYGYKIRVALPTNIAVKTAADFQRQFSTMNIGYATSGNITYGPESQIVYATAGHFTNRILYLYKQGKFYEIQQLLGDIFIIDEIHTSTIQITLLIGLINYLRGNLNANFKLIFTTATYNEQDISSYFSGYPILNIRGDNKPIEIIYSSVRRNILQYDPNPEILNIVKREIDKWRHTPKKYHGIIFRPGVHEIEKTIKYLESNLPSSDPVRFYPAYSSLDPEQLSDIFKDDKNMKIIVGTGLIGSSITVPDVGFVIDDMLEKSAETNPTGGIKLMLSIIPKSTSLQRQGRTGRTMEGRVYKLITQEDYEILPQFKSPEINRVPIYDIILKLLAVDINPPDVLKLTVARFSEIWNILINLNMLENLMGKTVLASSGIFISKFDISLFNAYMIYLAYTKYNDQSNALVLRTVIAVACMIESYGPSYFLMPRRKKEMTNQQYNVIKQNHIAKYHEKFRGSTDIHTFVNMFWMFMTDSRMNDLYNQSSRHIINKYISEWTKNNSINQKKFREFLICFQQNESIINSMLSYRLDSSVPQEGITPSSTFEDNTYTQLGNATGEIFKYAYKHNKFLLQPGNKYLDPINKNMYKINYNSTFNRLKYPTEITAAHTIEIIQKDGTHIFLAGIIS